MFSFLYHIMCLGKQQQIIAIGCCCCWQLLRATTTHNSTQQHSLLCSCTLSLEPTTTWRPHQHPTAPTTLSTLMLAITNPEGNLVLLDPTESCLQMLQENCPQSQLLLMSQLCLPGIYQMNRDWIIWLSLNSFQTWNGGGSAEIHCEGYPWHGQQ